jgi:S-adenosylmethionine-dependent methyltransferase
VPGWTADAADGPDAVVDRWLARLGSVRNVVRQELAARFVAAHLPDRGRALRVVDVGCGQGTQAIRLARLGHDVDGVDPDTEMLDAFADALADEAPATQARIRLHRGRADDLPHLLAPHSYDVVLCHGVLMYVEDPAPVVEMLAGMAAPGGVASILARNQAGIAFRAGYRGRWDEALAALQGDPAYVNELGAEARADTVAGLLAEIERAGLEPLAWYGVRVLSDGATLEANPPAPGSAELDTLLAAEELAGRTDPYRWVAPLFQVVARAADGAR